MSELSENLRENDTGLFQDRKDEHYINFYCEACAREIGGIRPDDTMEIPD